MEPLHNKKSHDPRLPVSPIYIISKGRSESRLTAKTLEAMNVPYRIVIEPQEYDAYAAVIDPKKILVLPFSNLGQGSIPARNWVWNHSVEEGHKDHWIMDDNIRYFYRMNRNVKTKVKDGTILRLAEEFVDRFENVPMSGLNYQYFCSAGDRYSPYYLNTRIYSCIRLSNTLIDHEKFAWRGKYNEDTDLSLRILKEGFCTILFNAFLCGKISTLVMKGGNTEGVYAIGNEEDFDNRYKFAKSLYDQHPDVVQIVQRYRRWHHEVDYSGFIRDNKLILKESSKFKNEPNERGLVLARMKE